MNKQRQEQRGRHARKAHTPTASWLARASEATEKAEEKKEKQAEQWQVGLWKKKEAT